MEEFAVMTTKQAAALTILDEHSTARTQNPPQIKYSCHSLYIDENEEPAMQYAFGGSI